MRVVRFMVTLLMVAFVAKTVAQQTGRLTERSAVCRSNWGRRTTAYSGRDLPRVFRWQPTEQIREMDSGI